LGAARPLAAEPRVILIGMDGLSWSVIDPLLAEGRMPQLAGLMQRGVSAELETVEPVISPTVWSSIATGLPPEQHGVSDFLKDHRSLKAATIFERLAVQGLRVGTYEYLVTWPPRPLPNGFVIPAWLRRDETTVPADALERAAAAAGAGYRYGNKGLTSRAAYAAASERELKLKAGQWNALAQAFDLQAGSVTFYAADAMSHRFWADSFPEDFDSGDAPEPEAAYAGLVQRTYRGLDRALGEIVAASPDASILIVSDHGFQARDGGVERIWTGNAELPLARAGLVPGRDAFRLEGQFAFTILRVESGPFAARDALLDRLAAFFRSAENADGEALFSVETLDMVERPAGATRSWLERLRQWGLRQLMRLLFSVRLDPDAHAYLLMRPNHDALEAAWPDGRIRIGGGEMPISDLLSADGFTGGHDPTAVFVAAGGPIRAVAGRQQLSVLDVAPLFAYLAGGAIPDDMHGRLPEEWIEPKALQALPPRFVPAANLPRLPDPVAPRGPEAEADLIERLRSMGYVD